MTLMSTVIVGNEPITTASCAICSFFYYFEPDFYSEMYNPISHLLDAILVPFICVTKRLPWSLTQNDFFLLWQKLEMAKDICFQMSICFPFNLKKLPVGIKVFHADFCLSQRKWGNHQYSLTEENFT